MGIKKTLELVSKIKYFKGITKKTTAKIDSIENPFEDYFVIKLRTEPGVTWKPGEHAIFKLPGKAIEGSDYRIFSVASIPEEGYLLLGTRTGKEPSSYKKQLITMTKGESVAMVGPFGWFLVKDNASPIVLFASGVGITPIRGLLKQLENDTSRAIEIVYAATNYYLFNEEIERITNNNAAMTLHKTRNPEETQKKLAELAKKYDNTAYYYVSGAPTVLQSTIDLLKSKGVKKKRIISDTFEGYKN